MKIHCDCGCGKTYLNKHMVIHNTDKKNYYIPHALRIFGLFFEPSIIRKKLDQSELTDFLYIFPCDKWYIEATKNTIPFGWKTYSSKYGLYFSLDNRS